MNNSELLAIRSIEDDDRAWFAAHPDREFRCRRMHNAEFKGEPPAGYWPFVILHRNDVGQSWLYVEFPAELYFNTDMTDAECRELLRATVKIAR